MGVSLSLYFPFIHLLKNSEPVNVVTKIITTTFIIIAGRVGGRPAVSSTQLLYQPLTLAQCVCVCVCERAQKDRLQPCSLCFWV